MLLFWTFLAHWIALDFGHKKNMLKIVQNSRLLAVWTALCCIPLMLIITEHWTSAVCCNYWLTDLWPKITLQRNALLLLNQAILSNTCLIKNLLYFSFHCSGDITRDREDINCKYSKKLNKSVFGLYWHMQIQWYRFEVKCLYTFGVAPIDHRWVECYGLGFATIPASGPNDTGTGAEYTCEHKGGMGRKNILRQNDSEIVIRLEGRSTPTAEIEIEFYDRSDFKYVARFEVNFTLPPSHISTLKHCAKVQHTLSIHSANSCIAFVPKTQ